MSVLHTINFEVPVYQNKAWPRYVSRECFRLPIWYLVVCAYAVLHIFTTSYDTISTKDHLHIGILVFVWVSYTVFLVIRSVWNLATIQSQGREYEYQACESCCGDMRGAVDGAECGECGAAFDREGGVERWTRYCDWARRHNKRARSTKKSVAVVEAQPDEESTES